MDDRDRIILGFSDAELLLWWGIFGYCPHEEHVGRLAKLLGASRRIGLDGGADETERDQQIDYARENLLGRHRPPLRESVIDVRESRMMTCNVKVA